MKIQIHIDGILERSLDVNTMAFEACKNGVHHHICWEITEYLKKEYGGKKYHDRINSYSRTTARQYLGTYIRYRNLSGISKEDPWFWDIVADRFTA